MRPPQYEVDGSSDNNSSVKSDASLIGKDFDKSEHDDHNIETIDSTTPRDTPARDYKDTEEEDKERAEWERQFDQARYG